MPQIRRLGAAAALVAAGAMVLSSVAAAHPGVHHQYGPYGFDNVWVDTEGLDVYVAPDGSRDKIVGRAGNDVIDAGDMRDLVLGNRGADTIDGGSGNDKLKGGIGADIIDGGGGHDKILGNPGADIIDGGPGRDIIKSGLGNDVIEAADGERDRIYCGPGDDTVNADEDDFVARNCETVTNP